MFHRFLLLAALMSASLFAQAKGSTMTPAQGSGFVRIEDAQRVRIFNEDRNTTTAEGDILVCTAGFRTPRQNQCSLEDDAKALSQWQRMENLAIPGYEIAGFAYVMAGVGYRHLYVYFRKKP